MDASPLTPQQREMADSIEAKLRGMKFTVSANWRDVLHANSEDRIISVGEKNVSGVDLTNVGGSCFLEEAQIALDCNGLSDSSVITFSIRQDGCDPFKSIQKTVSESIEDPFSRVTRSVAAYFARLTHPRLTPQG